MFNKNIVKFNIVNANGNVTIDAYNPDFQEMETKDFLDTYLPFTRLFEHITIKNFRTIPEELLSRLTNQYLHGAEITFATPNKSFSKTYKAKFPTPFYSYKWCPLDLTKPMPKSLASFKFVYNGKSTTYFDAIASLKSTSYLPNEIWNALDIYSKQQIDKCREYNKGNYSYAEQWYKDLMRDCLAFGINVFSPNRKTYYEVIAEVNFDMDCHNARLEQGLRPLDIAEIAFLKHYAPIYGVEIPKFRWHINSRKTDHGYTEEPEVCLCGMSNSDWNKVIFDPRNDNNLPSFVRKNLSMHETETDKGLRDAFFQLKWIMKHLGDEGLMPGWKRCPVCHKLYRESDGCECGACEPIHFVSADKLFYGDSLSYEDYDSTSGAYEDLEDFTDDMFELVDLDDLD